MLDIHTGATAPPDFPTHQGNGNAVAAFLGLICATFLGIPGALFWFAPLQREGMRSPSCKAGASAI